MTKRLQTANRARNDGRKADAFCIPQLFIKATANPKFYLTECLELGEAEFLLALRDVVEARGGIAELARTAHLNRESLYRLLSRKGNPTLSSLNTILSALGIELHFAPKAEAA